MDTIGNLDSGVLFDAVALAAVATFLLSLVKPFVELLPFARASSPTHDATLRLLNVLLNIALALLVALAAGQLTATTYLPLILQGLAQAAGAHTLYHTTTHSGSSIGKNGNDSGNVSGNDSGNDSGNISGNKIGNTGNDDTASIVPSLSAAQIAAISTSLASA